MANSKCAICNKTASPLESVNAGGKAYHKLCFKCAGCKCTLNVATFKAHDGGVFCKVCCPKATHTAVADSVATRQALNAPKKKAEGLATVQKGTGEAPKVGLDTLGVQNALKAPKRKAEGLQAVQKGTGEGSHVGLDAMGVQSALKAPKKKAEGLQAVQKGTGEAPKVGLDTMGVQNALKAPKAKTEGITHWHGEGADTGFDRPAVEAPASAYLGHEEESGDHAAPAHEEEQYDNEEEEAPAEEEYDEQPQEEEEEEQPQGEEYGEEENYEEDEYAE